MPTARLGLCLPVPVLVLVFGVFASACSSSDAVDGGTSTTGTHGSGGATGSGGTSGTGGAVGTGGSVGTGGAVGSGGVVGSGGMTTSRGSGGDRGSGGAPGSGGTVGSGGTGAVTGSGGKGVAGSMGSGGQGGGGGKGSGNTGGDAAGGMSGAGGAGAGGTDSTCPPATPRTGGKQYCGTSADGTADGSYSYNLYSDGKGSGCMTVYGVDATFKANWTNVGDWIARVGLSFDKTKTYDQLGTFSSDFAYTTTAVTTGGFGNLGIYGWSVNPLHEYYIAENWLGSRPNFTKVGQFTIDGEGTYDIQTNMQKNQPNITGTNADFVQFWSVRTTPRTCGHVSISKHFQQWASLGLQLGSLEEARILVEAQNNSGTIDFTTATVVVTK